MTAGVYVLIDPRDATPFYVGKGLDVARRVSEHRKGRRGCSTCERILDIRNAGMEYAFDVVEYVDNPKSIVVSTRSHWSGRLNLTALNDAEIWWIAYFKALGWPLTNATAGGDGAAGRSGWTHTPDARAKISNAMRAAQLTGERNPAKRADVKAKIRVAALARGPRPDVSLAKRGVTRPDIAGARNPIPLGSKRSEETKRKIAEATRRRMSDPDVKAKMCKPRQKRAIRPATEV